MQASSTDDTIKSLTACVHVIFVHYACSIKQSFLKCNFRDKVFSLLYDIVTYCKNYSKSSDVLYSQLSENG